jgi:iron complex outermembrane receptor protein
MRKNVNVFGVCIGLLVASSLPSMPAHAQTSTVSVESDTIEEITVTAQRRAESIMSVPVAVSAFSQKDLENLGITNSSELAGQVPSLQVNSAFGAAQPNFTVRGIGVANEHNPNQASPIGVWNQPYFPAE